MSIEMKCRYFPWEYPRVNDIVCTGYINLSRKLLTKNDEKKYSEHKIYVELSKNAIIKTNLDEYILYLSKFQNTCLLFKSVDHSSGKIL